MFMSFLLFKNNHHKQKTQSDFPNVGGGGDVREMRTIWVMLGQCVEGPVQQGWALGAVELGAGPRCTGLSSLNQCCSNSREHGITSEVSDSVSLRCGPGRCILNKHLGGEGFEETLS